MKSQILKIAGVKSEKEFYKKYPTEEAFMKAHGKAFKKAQIGAYIGGDTIPNASYVDINDALNAGDKMITGSTQQERDEAAYKQAMLDAQASKGGGGESSGGAGGMDLGGLMNMFGGEGGGGIEELAVMAARYGTHIPKAAYGTNTNNWWSNLTTTKESTYPLNINQTYGIGAQTMGKMQTGPANNPVGKPVDTSDPNWMNKQENPYVSASNPEGKSELNIANSSIGQEEDKGLANKLGGLTKLMGPVGAVIEGIDALKSEQEAAKVAQQQRLLSELTLKASTTRPEQRERKYVRPEDVVNTGEAFFPIYGVGTNPLARNGVRLQEGGMIGGNPTEIQNTYGNGNSLYDNLEYTPLVNPFKTKTYRGGGNIPVAENGFDNWQNSMNGGGSGFSGAGESGGTPWGTIGHTATGVGQAAMGGQNAGGKIGGTAGKAIGSIFGPAGGAIGEFAGGMIGNALDPYQRRIKKDAAATKKNIQNMAFNQIAPSIQAGYASHMEDGGYVSNDWTPQVIAKFGDLDAQDFADFAHKDQFRSGGHLKEYTPPSERAMQTFAMGGQLETHWGGGAEVVSYNHHMPGSGETIKFTGNSHTQSDGKGNTGIGITYGKNPVEVENNETMYEMPNGGEINPQTGEQQTTGVVLGNMVVDKKVAATLNDPELMEIAEKYHGKKFKNIDFSKDENKQNKIIAKTSDALDALKVENSIDKAKLAGLQLTLDGADMKLAKIANTKMILANYQNAINDAKEEWSDAIGKNISAEDLARGYIKLDKDPVTMNAKNGGEFYKAQDGTKPKKFKSAREAANAGYIKGDDGKYHRKIKKFSTETSETKAADALGYIPAGQKQNASGLWGKVTPQSFEEAKKANPWFDWSGFDPKDKNDVKNYQRAFNARAKAVGSSARIEDDGDFGEQTVTARIDESKKSTPANTEEELTAIIDEPAATPEVKANSRFPWEIGANQILKNFIPTDQEPFDYDQLLGEYYTLTNNQLEPVQAQMYHPELGIPYDISYQEMLNQNQADYNAAQRKMAYNPAALAMLNAQKYEANEKVLAEQFRANQAMKDKVYGENRNTLNQAKLTNLGILDKQYERQSEAMSNTKATTQAALNSIADKYAKHKLENRLLSIYENMYNYRFGKNGRSKNYNPLQFFDTTVGGTKSKDDTLPGYKAMSYDKNGNVLTWKKITDTDKTTTDDDLEAVGGIKDRNGGSVKKNNKNSSILRAFKNL